MGTDLRRIMTWLNDMTAQVMHPQGRPSKDDLAVRAAVLAEDFPDEAFCRASFSFVLRGEEYWPPYERMRAKLSSWWERNRPRRPVLAVEGPAEPTQEDRLRAEGEALTEEEVLRSVREIEALEGPLRGALMRALCSRINRWAPQHAALLPLVGPQDKPEVIVIDADSPLGRAFEERHGRQIGTLTAAQLAAFRKTLH